jgi:hypothetical protein
MKTRMLGITLGAVAMLTSPLALVQADTADTHLVGTFTGYYSDSFGGLYYGGLEVAGVWEGTAGTETDYSCYPTDMNIVGPGQYDATLQCEWGYESYHVSFGVPDVVTAVISFRSDGLEWTMSGVVEGHPLACSGLVNPLLSSDDPDFPDYRADGSCEIT